MTESDWTEGGWTRTIGMYLPGDAPEIRDRNGQQVRDDDFLLLLNSYHEKVPFRIPEDLNPSLWSVVLDTSMPEIQDKGERPGPDGKIDVPGRTFMLLRRPPAVR